MDVDAFLPVQGVGDDVNWSCVRCTFENHLSIPYCEMCNEKRQAPPAAAPQSVSSEEVSHFLSPSSESAPSTVPTPTHDHYPSSTVRSMLASIANRESIPLTEIYRAINEYQDLTGEDPAKCVEAFERHNWDLEKARGEYLTTLASPERGYCENSGAVDCTVCFCEAAPGEALQLLACSHTFCKECISEQVKARMEQGDVEIPCLAHGCTHSLTHAEVKQAAGGVVFTKLAERGLDRAAALEPSLHHCPTPDCRYVVSFDPASDAILPEFTCPLCVSQHCLSCGGSPYHTGKSCAEFKLSLRSEAEERATLEYMKESGIRTCAKCGMAVLKSSGCDKMKCRCGYKFCYVCLRENATCNCTGSNHGFWDNILENGDFT